MATKKKSRRKTKKAKTKVRSKKARKTTKRSKAVKSTKRKAAAAKRAPKAPARSKSATQLPDLTLATTGGKTIRLSDLKGKNVVLYFYPKDDTPGCTTEGCDIRDHFTEFGQRNTVVLGVSRDSVASHENFKAKFNFPFDLVSDPEEKLCRAFDVIRQKSLYGRTYMGVDRSTFIFDTTGKLRKEFRGVKVPGHIDEILHELGKL